MEILGSNPGLGFVFDFTHCRSKKDEHRYQTMAVTVVLPVPEVPLRGIRPNVDTTGQDRIKFLRPTAKDTLESAFARTIATSM